MPTLLDGLRHPSRGVAVTAADFLARLGRLATGGGVGEALRRTAKTHDDYHVRYRANQALRAITGDALTTAEVMR